MCVVTKQLQYPDGFQLLGSLSLIVARTFVHVQPATTTCMLVRTIREHIALKLLSGRLRRLEAWVRKGIGTPQAPIAPPVCDFGSTD